MAPAHPRFCLSTCVSLSVAASLVVARPLASTILCLPSSPASLSLSLAASRPYGASIPPSRDAASFQPSSARVPSSAWVPLDLASPALSDRPHTIRHGPPPVPGPAFSKPPLAAPAAFGQRQKVSSIEATCSLQSARLKQPVRWLPSDNAGRHVSGASSLRGDVSRARRTRAAPHARRARGAPDPRPCVRGRAGPWRRRRWRGGSCRRG